MPSWTANRCGGLCNGCWICTRPSPESGRLGILGSSLRTISGYGDREARRWTSSCGSGYGSRPSTTFGGHKALGNGSRTAMGTCRLQQSEGRQQISRLASDGTGRERGWWQQSRRRVGATYAARGGISPSQRTTSRRYGLSGGCYASSAGSQAR